MNLLSLLEKKYTTFQSCYWDLGIFLTEQGIVQHSRKRLHKVATEWFVKWSQQAASQFKSAWELVEAQTENKQKYSHQLHKLTKKKKDLAMNSVEKMILNTSGAPDVPLSKMWVSEMRAPALWCFWVNLERQFSWRHSEPQHYPTIGKTDVKQANEVNIEWLSFRSVFSHLFYSCYTFKLF